MDVAKDILQEKLVALEVFGLLAALISYIAFRKGYYRFPYPDQGSAIRFWDLLGAFLVFLGMEVVVFPLVALAFGVTEPDSGDKGWLNLLAILLICLGVLAYPLLMNRKTKVPVWGLQSFTGENVKHFLMGSLTWLIAYPIVIAIGQLISLIISTFFVEYKPEQTAVKQLKTTIDNPLLFVGMVILIAFFVPIVEEILFRGYLLNWIKRHLGRGAAIVLSAVIFAFFHYTTEQGVGNIELLLSLFVLALFLGFIYEREQSLWGSIGLHSTFNAFNIGLIYLGL